MKTTKDIIIIYFIRFLIGMFPKHDSRRFGHWNCYHTKDNTLDKLLWYLSPQMIQHSIAAHQQQPMFRRICIGNIGGNEIRINDRRCRCY
jgi:hypothetical protein